MGRAEIEQLALLPAAEDAAGLPPERFVPPEWVAIVAVVDRLQRQTYHWPIGHTIFQKLVYFASQTGIPTGLEFERNNYGPFARKLKSHIARLQNNGLAIEEQRGNLFEIRSDRPIPMPSRTTAAVWRLGARPSTAPPT